MPALGILTCEILELEFAHLLISDPEISRVTVVEEDYSQALTALLEESGLRPRRIKGSAMKENIEEFNRMFGFRTETRPGTLNLLTQAWSAAKKSLTG